MTSIVHNNETRPHFLIHSRCAVAFWTKGLTIPVSTHPRAADYSGKASPALNFSSSDALPPSENSALGDSYRLTAYSYCSTLDDGDVRGLSLSFSVATAIS